MNESVDKYTSTGVTKPSLQNRVSMGSTLIFNWGSNWSSFSTSGCRERNQEDKEAKQGGMGAWGTITSDDVKGLAPVLAD